MDLRAKTRTFLRERLLGGVAVADDASLWDAGLIDSIGLLYLVHFLEKELSIRIPEKDINMKVFRSVESILEYAAKKKGA